MLPLALWFGIVPALDALGFASPFWVFPSFLAAVLTAALASQWFKRTYGVVTPSADSFTLRMRGTAGVAFVAAIFGLELLATATQLAVRPGIVVLGASFIWQARASKGLRPHLYVLGAVCVAVAFVPLIISQTWSHDSWLGQSRALWTIFTTAFGLGWAYVSIQDYRVLRRSIRQVGT
ncbi:MAG TPA: hypothetical protein VGF24_27000 [Vicinamibacterales bacterium]